MRAVVLVGGRGTRLQPLTLTAPKPMLPVGHRPILEHLLVNLAKAGVTEATLALGFLPDPFIDAYPDGECAGITLRYVVEDTPLDTAGAIRFAAEASGITETFIVANGDIMTDLDVSELVAHHRACGGLATIHLIPVEDPSAFGVVEIDDSTCVQRFLEKPAPGTTDSKLINAGTYVLEPEVLRYIETGRKVSIEREVFPALYADRVLYAMERDVYWLDTGRPELYLQANFDLIDGVRPTTSASAIHETATVAATARIDRSVVGAGAVVGNGCVIVDSVLLPNAVVSDRAIVITSSVMGVVGAGAVIRDTLVGINGTVADNERLVEGRRPEND